MKKSILFIFLILSTNVVLAQNSYLKIETATSNENKLIDSISDRLLNKISIIEDKIIKKEKNYNKVCALFTNIYNYVQEIKKINNNNDYI